MVYKKIYAFYLDTAYVNRGSGWIKPQYMLAVDPYITDECGDCDPLTGESEGVNDLSCLESSSPWHFKQNIPHSLCISTLNDGNNATLLSFRFLVD